VELELHQLDVRYEALRVRRPEHERRLLASLAEHGQQVPIVVVAGDETGRFVVIDGHKRLRALRRLRCDTVLATVWALSEGEALLLSRSLRQAEAETALEQGWLLCELRRTFGLDLATLAQCFDRSPSWVSRRLALVQQLPEAVQERVRLGEIGAHAAMKHLVPMARVDREACCALASAIAHHRLSTEDVGRLYAAWRRGTPALRARVVEDPLLFLKVEREVEEQPTLDATETLLKDLDLLGALARRALRRYSDVARTLPDVDRTQLARAALQAQCDLERLTRRLAKEEEESHARSQPAHGDPGAAQAADPPAHHRPDTQGLAPGGAQGHRKPVERAPAHPACGEGRALPQRDPGALRLVPGQPGPSP
jgi:ParB family chromosome partitioning protein